VRSRSRQGWPAIVALGWVNALHVVAVQQVIRGAVVRKNVVASETSTCLQQSSCVELCACAVHSACCGPGDFANAFEHLQVVVRDGDPANIPLPSVLHILRDLLPHELYQEGSGYVVRPKPQKPFIATRLDAVLDRDLHQKARVMPRLDDVVEDKGW
jgi:hypothetical protein